MDLTEIKVFEQQVGTLKLSAAIRIGAAIRPKCTRVYFDSGKSCALGAAWEGAGMPGEPENYGDVAQLFHASCELMNGIARMNDRGRSRESIADWLEANGL